MPRKKPRTRPLDSMQSAVSIFASVMATDEEYAAGEHLKNPGAILAGRKAPAKKKTKAAKRVKS